MPVEAKERQLPVATSPNLDDMKLPELKELAKQMGLRGVSTMRKTELIATLQAARSGGQAPAGVTVRAPKSAPAADAEVKSAKDKKADEAKQEERPVRAKQAKSAESSEVADAVAAVDALKPNDEAPKRRRHRDTEAGADLLAELGLDDAAPKQDDRRRRRDDDRRDDFEPRRRRRVADGPKSEDVVRDLDDILATLPSQEDADDDKRRDETEDNEYRHSRGRNDRRGRRMREPKEDLVPVAGIVDVLDSYAFVRTSGYLPGPNDVYVSMGQVKKYGLRKGDAVHGSIRAPREGERRNQRQKFVPLQSIDSINGMSVEEAQHRPQFSKLTPLYPQERLKQETTPNKLTGRLIDIVAPIGKGQRGLIVSPPKAGKTITLQNIANAIATNNPEVHLMVVLVDERPEEVTDMERTVQGEVISSTFDRPASDHTTVAELAIERAKRLVELGQDVVVLLDSMTRLARAYNIAAPASGRILSGGVDAQALYPPKKFFGAARNIENGGSLTIISSALVETGSKMDEVIFEEFKGTGNMELRLSRELADKRLFPAIDVNASGTRREELITDPQELPIIYRLRRLLGGLEPEQAYQTLVPRLKKTATNRDFMASLIQQSGNATNGN